MSLLKTSEFQVLSVESAEGSTLRGHGNPFVKTAHRHHFDYVRRQGYIYVRSRAISSRTNDNFDQFPASEIKAAYRTFIGKPVFVNHHNSNHRRARGFIIDAALHEDTNPDGTPDTWAEVLMEVDAVKFPRLAEACVKGDIARTSMGTDVRYSVCTACGNKAETPADYCNHIPKMKGMKLRRVNAATGRNEEVLIAEVCYGLGFFENSLLVEDPADPTAHSWVDDGGTPLQAAASKTAAAEDDAFVRRIYEEAQKIADANGESMALFDAADSFDGGSAEWYRNLVEVSGATPLHHHLVDIARERSQKTAGVAEVMDFLRGGRDAGHECSDCGSTFRWNPATMSFSCPQGHLDRPDLSAYAKTMGPAHPDDFSDIDQMNVGDLVWAQHDRMGHVPGLPAKVIEKTKDHVVIRYDHSGAEKTVTTEGLDYDWDIHPYTGKVGFALSRKVAHGETKAPAKVDTLRADRCPVCRDDEAFNGDKCSVCGHVEPPSNFRDPDLTKAQDFDRAQDAAPGQETPTFDPPGEMTTQDPNDPMAAPGAPGEKGSEGALECNACGEVFDGAEGQPEADPDVDPEGEEEPKANPFAKDTEQENPEDDQDEDLLADLKDDKPQPPDPNDQDPDQEEPAPPQEEAPVAGEVENAPSTPTEDSTCPVCGEGTLVPQMKDPAPAEPEEVESDEDDDQMSKEQVDMNQPNPAQQKRSALMRAVANQQRVIEAQRGQIGVLTAAVRDLVTAAGVQRNPRFASLMRQAADDTISMTTEQARQPAATDSPENQGSVPAAANTEVTPAATTDVSTSNVALPEDKPLDNLQDVTQAVQGTDAVDPDAVFNGDVRATPGSDQKMDPEGSGGWETTNPGSTNRAQSSIERFTASLRLARLQISLGQASGEDLTVAQSISNSGQ